MKNLQYIKNPLCRFISSVCIACSVIDCHIFKMKQVEFLFPLLQMLQVEPNPENKTIPYFSYLLNITSESYR